MPREQVTDTEDLIALDLDHRRNELVALNLVVNCIMLMFALVSAVTGAFGMNLATVRTANDATICTLLLVPRRFDYVATFLTIINMHVLILQWMGVMDVTASRVRMLRVRCATRCVRLYWIVPVHSVMTCAGYDCRGISWRPYLCHP
jgi:hypothetical protein